MEQETLFTSAKWNILKALALEKKSPLELSEIANTSMSNISQSLRFLELANIVKSEKVSNRDKGQPRIVYSIAQDTAYLIITSKGFVEKQTIQINEHKKTLIRIWLYKDENKHNAIEQTYLELKEHIKDIDGIYIEENTNKIRTITKNNKTIQIKNKTMEHKEITREELQKEPKKYYPIYDPQKINQRIT